MIVVIVQIIRDHHDILALEENDHRETDLLQLEINNGDIAPIKQSVRRMPFVAREEVAKQLKRM